MTGLELDTDLEVSDNEEDDAAAVSTLASMIARDDALETPAQLPAPASAFAQPPGSFAQPRRRLAHSQSTPANMTCVPGPSRKSQCQLLAGRCIKFLPCAALQHNLAAAAAGGTGPVQASQHDMLT